MTALLLRISYVFYPSFDLLRVREARRTIPVSFASRLVQYGMASALKRDISSKSNDSPRRLVIRPTLSVQVVFCV
jgi:hypothetical protein